MCGSSHTDLFHRDKHREYAACTVCGIVFVPDRFVLSEVDEKKEYDLHENFNEDEGYRRFLMRAAAPLLECFPDCSGVRGLDFGCGPNPLLAKILRDSPYEFHVDIYDKYYFPNTVKFEDIHRWYNFVVSTEVFEHLQSPLDVFVLLWGLLQTDGVLVIMTKRMLSFEKFVNWHYIRDPTHISFFSEKTFLWVGEQLSNKEFKCTVSFQGPDVTILRKTEMSAEVCC